ncbi:ABC transporter substrate-binding protein [Pseudohoeflea coraliihabitans]|uniref:ABC transporter substrate-binding protein n=1 Tax=Pseudohoeflea coraliihabitans TaxID=2860393 RepID=A0ABS6WJI2_9HYPH|nr:ABC transporter substrate-binding protein [Pseudohoeflea sp. DP4N28-3]MBW3096010.1 ABC transporter substrate-binding protein [Pseudohoeflea sp. DP4N28-3]
MSDKFKTTRRRLLLSAAAIPLVTLAGLTIPVAPAWADDSVLYGPSDPAAKQGGSLTVGSLIEPPSFDIYHQAGEAVNFVAPLMYQTLVYADHDGNPHPLLAESWEVSEDLTEYTFRLRSGVTFHTGQPLEATDVKYGLDYMRNPDNGTIGALDFADLEEVEVVDPLTVVVRLKKPNSAFLITLTHRNGSVVPRNWFDGETSRTELNSKSVGTGPFKLAEFVQNSYMRLQRNPDYWQPGLPYLDEIIINFIPNSAGMLVAARNGRVDMAVLVRPQDADQLKNDTSLTVQRSRSLNQKSLDLDSTYGPLEDERVRRAVALLIDKEAVMQAAISGYGQVLGMMVPGMQDRWGVPLDDLPNQKVDVEKAKALLAEAGHPDGIDLELRTIIGYDWMEPAALTLAQQLQKGGVRVTIERLDLGTWLQNFRAKKMGFTLNDWGTPPDPNILYYRHFHQPPEGADFRNWANADGSRLLDEGRQTGDDGKRREIYNEFQRLLAESVPTVMMFGSDHIVVVSDAVRNHTMHPIGWHFGLVKTWIDQE